MKIIIATVIITAIFLGASCNDKPNNTILNRDPNGTSELQLSMREMYDYFESIKSQIKEGATIDDVKLFDHILTDKPTEEGKNATPIYKTMAEAYFLAVKTMNEEKTKTAFNDLVNGCMNCHQQVCPGPMVKIKKLYL